MTNVAAIGAKIAGLPACACRGHIINKIPGTMILYHAIVRDNGLIRCHHTHIANISCNGFSHEIRILGDVAS